MTWLSDFACALVDQAAIQSEPEPSPRWRCPSCDRFLPTSDGQNYDRRCACGHERSAGHSHVVGASVSDPPALTPDDVAEDAYCAARAAELLETLPDGRLEICARCQRWTDRPAPPDPLRPHLAAVLEIVRRNGGYMSPEDQAILAAASEAVRHRESVLRAKALDGR